MAVPAGFVDLLTASAAPVNTFVSIIGTVVDIRSAYQNRIGQWQCTYRLQDRRLRNSVNGQDGLTVVFFKDQEKLLPQVQALGDIIMIRPLKVMSAQGQSRLVSNHQTRHMVFPSKNIPSKAFDTSYMSGQQKLEPRGATAVEKQRVTLEETSYIINLKAEFLDVQPSTKDAAPLLPGIAPGNDRSKLEKARLSKKFQLVKDLQHHVFADICGEVVKKYNGQFGRCDLYITDYTQNKQMFYYQPPEEAGQNTHAFQDGDQFGYNGPPKRQWPGPYGFYVLKVTLSDPHAHFANERVNDGDVILLQNVKIKIGGNSNYLEGDMWPDNLNPSKVQIQFMKNHDLPEMQGLQERRKKYWSERGAKGLDAPKGASTEPAAMSKGKKKRERQAKKLKQAEEAAAAEGVALTGPLAAQLAKKKTNPHIRCSHEDIPLTPLSNIVSPLAKQSTNNLANEVSYVLPFQNTNHRTRVRVLDFDPPAIEDFALQVGSSDSETESLSSWTASTASWEWSFSLLLGSCSVHNEIKQWVNVSHLDAQFLLGNNFSDDPCDLREHRQVLGRLREKLNVLWGDLEELKAKAEDEAPERGFTSVSNVPFSCCLAGYGMLRDAGIEGNVEDWTKEFMMHGVTLL